MTKKAISQIDMAIDLLERACGSMEIDGPERRILLKIIQDLDENFSAEDGD